MHVSTQERDWITKDWESEGAGRSATASSIYLPVEGIAGLGSVGKFRLEKGFEFKPHRHRDWVIVTVLSGRLKVATGGDAESCVYEAGEVYVAAPGELHRETMLEDTEVVVVTGPRVVGESYATHVIDV